MISAGRLESMSSPPTNAAGLPRLPLDLSQHKRAIAIPWIITIISSGILPIVGFFALHYGVPSLSFKICLAPWLGLMGVTSIFSLGMRSWDLMKKTSDCRPLGQQNGWGLDYFGWNFFLGFLGLTALITTGITLESLVVVSLPLSVLILYVSLELLAVPIAMALGARAPLRFSSIARGESLRPGSYVIAEDVVAVDGKQGRAWRQAWSDRYEASPALRGFLKRMDVIWGSTGLMVVAVIWGVALGVHNKEIGYAIGWALPWLWAGGMTVLTIQLAKRMLREEAKAQGQQMAA